MLNTIETRLSLARRLLSLAEVDYEEGRNDSAASKVEDVCAQLLVIGREMRADDALMFGCGHCGHKCHVNELKSGACPRCGTLKDGVLVVGKIEPKPTGHCVLVDGWRV